MSNHYHFLVETPDTNLSQGMRQLNGVFTQSMNRKPDIPHLFRDSNYFPQIQSGQSTDASGLASVMVGVRSCILHSFFFKLWIFYPYLV
jgi:hypothetical protein